MVLSGLRSNYLGVLVNLVSELDEVLSRPLRIPVRSARQQQTRLSPGEVAELVDAYQAGASMASLAARWSLHRETVALHLRRAGVEPRKPGLPAVALAEVIRLYAAGWSLARLGDRFGCDAETIRSHIRAAGVRTRRPWERP